MVYDICDILQGLQAFHDVPKIWVLERDDVFPFFGVGLALNSFYVPQTTILMDMGENKGLWVWLWACVFQFHTHLVALGSGQRK